MTTSRDELITDWRQQLSAAQSAVADSPHSAWLARVRVRLYRFLLASYGDARWTADEVVDSPRDTTTSARGAIGTHEGKPPKSLGQIRTVLKAVASAQADPHPPGPLTRGLPPESWVIVAAASSKLKVGRCCELLRAGGLQARRAYRGDDHMVEVPACQRQQAFEIIERNRVRMHAPPKTPRTQRIPLWCRIAAAAVISMWVTGLLAGAAFLAIWALATGRRDHALQAPANMLDMAEFYRLWISLFVAILLLAVLGIIRRSRPIAAAKRSSKRKNQPH